jgi:hypothetical protein
MVLVDASGVTRTLAIIPHLARLSAIVASSSRPAIVGGLFCSCDA